MSLKKMHEERKEIRQSSEPQKISSADSMQETKTTIIEQQRLRIESLEKENDDVRKKLVEKLQAQADQYEGEVKALEDQLEEQATLAEQYEEALKALEDQLEEQAALIEQYVESQKMSEERQVELEAQSARLREELMAQKETSENELKTQAAKYEKKLQWKENQLQDARAGADKQQIKASEIQYVYRYKDKCDSCSMEEQLQSTRRLRRYIRFLTVLLVAGIICEILQSRIFLQDVLEFCTTILSAIGYLIVGSLFAGHYLAESLGWLKAGSSMYVAGQLMQILLPVAFYAAFVFVCKYYLPSAIKWFKDRRKSRHIPRMLGIHVICAGMIIALCCARLIPEYGGFRVNSMIIPIGAYLIWIGICHYHEGGWWFKDWTENNNRWW